VTRIVLIVSGVGAGLGAGVGAGTSHTARARVRPCGRYISKRSCEAASFHIRSSCSTGTDLTLRYGHRLMPFARQIFLSDVRHMPRCFATAFSGILKYLDSSCIESSMTCVGIRGPGSVAPPWRRAVPRSPHVPALPLHVLTTHLGWQSHRGGGWSAAAQDRSVYVTYVLDAPGCCVLAEMLKVSVPIRPLEKKWERVNFGFFDRCTRNIGHTGPGKRIPDLKTRNSKNTHPDVSSVCDLADKLTTRRL
jgi:hypothetical protein